MDKSNELRRIATQLACADLTNGVRTFWIYDISDEKLERIAKASVKLAQFIITQTEKP